MTSIENDDIIAMLQIMENIHTLLNFSDLMLKLHRKLSAIYFSCCDTAVRTQYVLPVTSPVSLLTQTSFHHTVALLLVVMIDWLVT